MAQKRLRAFLSHFFTGGVVTENGSCSAAFCESAALWGHPFRHGAAVTGGVQPAGYPLSHLALLDASSPKGTPYGNVRNLPATTEAVPLGKVA